MPQRRVNTPIPPIPGNPVALPLSGDPSGVGVIGSSGLYADSLHQHPLDLPVEDMSAFWVPTWSVQAPTVNSQKFYFGQYNGPPPGENLVFIDGYLDVTYLNPNLNTGLFINTGIAGTYYRAMILRTWDLLTTTPILPNNLCYLDPAGNIQFILGAAPPAAHYLYNFRLAGTVF